MIFSPFDYLKLAGGAVLGAALAYYPAYFQGKSVARSQIEAEAAKNALDRIQELEQNNAAFKSLSEIERCRVFMRDSGLPIDACE